MEFKIHLKEVRLYGYHGVHPLEKVIGTFFLIDLDIHIDLPEQALELHDSIDYASVFNILKTEFEVAEDLLENLTSRIIQKITDAFKGIKIVEITIYKERAPIDGLQGRVGVSLKRTFDER